MRKKSNTLFVIVGPTAVGKTDLCIHLAHWLNTEIISADSRQFFKEMQIGTAKPTKQEMDGVPHHFVGHISIDTSYNAGQFEKDVMQLLEDKFKWNKSMIMTGGSGLYIKAVCDGIDEMPEIPAEIREELNREKEEKGLAFLQQMLKEVDPAYYEIVDLKNPQRVIRALELYRATGKNMSYYRDQQHQVDRPFNIVKIGLERDRDVLYERINLRMDLMIGAGLFEEAQALYPQKDLNALQTVGYQEIFQYLDGEYDKEEAIRLLKRNSRRYAKRQMTWFKKDEEITWFHPDQVDEIKQFIEQSLED